MTRSANIFSEQQAFGFFIIYTTSCKLAHMVPDLVSPPLIYKLFSKTSSFLFPSPPPFVLELRFEKLDQESGRDLLLYLLEGCVRPSSFPSELRPLDRYLLPQLWSPSNHQPS